MEEPKVKKFRPHRIPLPAGGFQVNFCRNAGCSNFGVAPGNSSRYSQQAKDSEAAYKMIGGQAMLRPSATCLICNSSFQLKSNVAVSEEIARLTTYLQAPEEPACRSSDCTSKDKGIISHAQEYQLFGQTDSGATRYRCKSCRKTFSVTRSTTPQQKRPEVNALVYRLLINKMPMRRICETAGIAPQTLYTKLRFLTDRVRQFARIHETALWNGCPLPPLLLSSDRQDYLINWGTSMDRRNIRLHGMGTADNRTSYVFAMHVDYDSQLDPGDVEMAALECGDYDILQPFRTFARVWLKRDWADEKVRTGRSDRPQKPASADGLQDESDAPWGGDDTKLPGRGMKVRDEYSLLAHMYIVSKMVAGSPHVALYLDQDPGLSAAANCAFLERIQQATADTFLVRIDKNMTIDQKNLAVARSAQRMAAFAKENAIPIAKAPQFYLQNALERRGFVKRWQDRWMDHPAPNQGEPRKALLHLTDREEMTNERRAALHLWGGMQGIDRYFMILRRRQSLLERPIQSASAQGRTFYGNNPYRPWVVESVLDLLRIAYNFHHKGQDKKTPAQRLGICDRAFSLEEILQG